MIIFFGGLLASHRANIEHVKIVLQFYLESSDPLRIIEKFNNYK